MMVRGRYKLKKRDRKTEVTSPPPHLFLDRPVLSQVQMSEIIKKVEQDRDRQGDELGARPKTVPTPSHAPSHAAQREVELEHKPMVHRVESKTPDTVLCEPSAPANSSESEGDERPWHNPRDLREYDYNGVELERDVYAYEKWLEKQRQKKEKRAKKKKDDKTK